MSVVKQIREPRVDYLELEKPALLRGFELLATAEGGVEKLRKVIRSLAVRGLLATQRPSDESAERLLARLRKVADGRRSKTIQGIHNLLADITGFTPPVGWAWASLSELGRFASGKTPSKGKAEYWNGTIPWVSPKDMKSPRLTDSEDHVSEKAVNDGLAIVPESSVLIVVRSGILRRTVPVAITAMPCTVNQDLKALTLKDPMMAAYVQLLIGGFESFILSNLTKIGTTVESMKFDEFSGCRFPLPPLAEQHRIVARVEELMTLCDELEARGRLADEQHARLTTTLFDALTTSDSAHTLADNWQRIAAHFDLLLDRPQAIDALEQTILQLAVRGLLVPQDTSDEPASKLLARIRVEKDRLIAEGKIKRDKSLPPVKSEEMSFEVPDGWAWARMNHISDNRLGKMLDRAKNTGKLYPYLRNTNVQWQRIGLDDLKKIRLEDHEVDEYRLAVGDLLICEGGYPGRCAIWNEPRREMFFQKALHRVRPLCGVLAEYLEICMRTDSQSGALEQYFTGATIKHFAGQELNRYAIPLPPLAEQHRIVSRVEHLRRLCDNLRERLNKVRATQTHFAEALVMEAVQPQRGITLG